VSRTPRARHLPIKASAWRAEDRSARTAATRFAIEHQLV
jgi:hypothetical protein